MIATAEFEAQVWPPRADMEKDIARRRGSVMYAVDLAERMQLFRGGCAEQPAPGRGTEPHHAGEIAVEIAEPHGPDNPRKVATKGANRLNGTAALVHGPD